MKKQVKKLKNKVSKKLETGKSFLRDQMFYLQELKQTVVRSVVLTAKMTTIALSLLFVTVFSGPVHNSYLQRHVGKNTVSILNPEGSKIRGSGTGFQVKAPSGKVYTLTNAHVCELQKDGMVLVSEKQNSGRMVPRRVIEVYSENDLCLVEGLEGYTGLTLADSVDMGELVWSIGYPLGSSMNTSSGLTKSIGKVLVAESQIPVDQCKGKNRKIQEIEGFFGFVIQICVVERTGMQTNVPTFPGNSGSPLVNFYGNVVGVIFASNNGTNWGYAVPLSDVKTFLSAY